ncbi:ATP-binding cassette sub-family A member 8-A [Caerostris darwini]|uniref:ATP-binding cassette sub-family A member 8-A n=1 Tax=Caerostris darwini TaxID=1538125 RepID=A0AAV4SXM7_9ARAC|nr:ATP-binding cassette sub-family A member 8-A [Caerostris darwini]
MDRHYNSCIAVKGDHNPPKDCISVVVAVRKLMDDLDLTSCSSTLSIKLNADQKRKLCVAIAVIGEPGVLLLDEPSSGMSPKARKLLWNVLQDYAKAGRAVVFITHHMDEAELLSDRIAFLNYGKLKFCGTPLSIKKAYSAGYHIKMSFNPESFLHAKEYLPSLLKNLPTKPKIVLTTDTEIYVKLRSFIGTHCADFFRKVEEHFKDITCNSFTISLFSLEDILYFASGKTKEDESKCVRIPQKEEETEQNKSWIYHRKLSTLTWYRIRLLRRNINAAFILVIPILLVLVVKSKFYKESPEPSVATIGPHLYRNETIHVVNETGKPLIFLETSMSRLDVNFVIKNPTEKFQSKAFITMNIQKFEILASQAEITWSFDFKLNRLQNLPMLQNFISNFMWETMKNSHENSLVVSINPRIKDHHFLDWKSFPAVAVMAFSTVFISVIASLEAIEERKKKIVRLVGSRTEDDCQIYWGSIFMANSALCILSLLIAWLGTPNVSSDWIALFHDVFCVPGCILTVYLIGHIFYKCTELGIAFSVLIITGALFMGYLTGIVKEVHGILVLNILTYILLPIYAPYGLLNALYEVDRMIPPRTTTSLKSYNQDVIYEKSNLAPQLSDISEGHLFSSSNLRLGN